MDNDQRIYRASKAKEILDSEVYQEAFTLIKEEFHQAWLQSPSKDVEGREKIFLMLKLLDKVNIALTSVMEDGTMATQDLLHEKTLIERAKDALLSNF